MLLRAYCQDNIDYTDYFYDVEFDNDIDLDIYITTKLPNNCIGYRVFSSRKEADAIERG